MFFFWGWIRTIWSPKTDSCIVWRAAAQWWSLSSFVANSSCRMLETPGPFSVVAERLSHCPTISLPKRSVSEFASWPPSSRSCWAASTRRWTSPVVPIDVTLASGSSTASLTWPAGLTRRSHPKTSSSRLFMAKANAAESWPPSEWRVALATTTCAPPIPASSLSLSYRHNQRSLSAHKSPFLYYYLGF